MVDLARTPSWLGPVSRAGFATKGVVYLLIGGLAVLAGAGEGGQVDGSAGAVRTIGEQPFGRFLLIAVAAGLTAYAVWCLTRAFLDPHRGRATTPLRRVAIGVAGLLHVALAVLAIKMATVGGGAGEASGLRAWVARGLEHPLGRLAIGGLGVGLAIAAVVQLVNAARGRLEHSVDGAPVAGREQTRLGILGRVGLAARAVVFAVVGVSLARAAWSARPEESRDPGGAMREIATLPFGDLLLAVVAAGLFAYGLYLVVCAVVARDLG